MKLLRHKKCILFLFLFFSHITMCMDEPPQKLLSLKPAGMGDLMTHFYNVPHEVMQLSSELQEMIVKEMSTRVWYLKTCFNHRCGVSSVTFSPNKGQIATGCAKEVHIFDLATRQCISEFASHEWVSSVAFSPNGKQLATRSSGKRACIFDLATRQCIHVFDHDKLISSVTFSPNGEQLAIGCSNAVCIFDLATRKCISVFAPHKWVSSVTFSSNGKQFATTGCIDGVHIFDLATRRCVYKFAHDDWVTSVAFSPNDEQLATGCSDRKVRIFNLATKQCIYVFDHKNKVSSVTFSPNGKQLATGCDDDGVRIFDLATRRCIYVFDHKKEASSVTFSPDGDQLAIEYDYGKAGKVRIFEKYLSKTYHESILLQMIFMWLNVAKHSKKIKNSDLMLKDIAKTFFPRKKSVQSHIKIAWKSFSVPLRDFIWNECNHIIQTYGKK